MRTFSLGLILSATVGLVSPAMANPPATGGFGRYVGVLSHAKLSQDQLAKVDFILSRTEENKLFLRAILTLSFGDFNSGEYVSYHFDDVKYDLLTGVLTFDQPDQDVSFVATKFSGGELEGQLVSVTSGLVGNIKLYTNPKAEPKRPLIESIEGEYRAVCEGKKQYIQLHTFKSTQDTSRVGNPFGANDIRGQMAQEDEVLCDGVAEKDDPRGRVCVSSQITSASYNFYTGKLLLQGFPKNLRCTVTSTGLNCENSCKYTRVSAETRSREFAPRSSAPAFEETSSGIAVGSGLAGTYVGYVHHEALNRYQRSTLTLTTYQAPEDGSTSLKLSAVASLSFGDFDDGETLSYKFAPTVYPNPLNSPQIVLGRMENDVDAIIRITSIKDGVVRGEWYSLVFGRVGTFEMSKGGAPSLAADAKFMDRVSGRFSDGEFWDLDLGVTMDRTPPNTDNPFFPLTFTGSLRGKEGLTATLPVRGGSFDFYTGKVGIQYGNDLVLTGARRGRERLNLRPMSAGFGTRFFRHEPKSFVLTDEN